MAVATVARTSVAGYVSPGFEAVRDAFADNFTRRGELGGACCVYRHGLKVVDLWGGVRNGVTGEPWQERTMAPTALPDPEGRSALRIRCPALDTGT